MRTISRRLQGGVANCGRDIPSTLGLRVPTRGMKVSRFLGVEAGTGGYGRVLRGRLEGTGGRRRALRFCLRHRNRYCVRLQGRLNRESSRCRRYSGGLGSHHLCRGLRGRLRATYGRQRRLQQRSRVLRCVGGRNQARVRQGARRFFTMDRRLPGRRQVLRSVVGGRTGTTLSLGRLYGGVRRVRLRGDLHGASRGRLLRLTEGTRTLRGRVATRRFTLRRGGAMRGRTLHEGGTRRGRHRRLSRCVLPRRLDRCDARPVPRGRRLFGCTTSVSRLARQCRTGRAQRTSCSRRIQGTGRMRRGLLSVTRRKQMFLRRRPRRYRYPLYRAGFRD